VKKVFAFIFARGGSKGLPRKNVLPLGGIPLVAHSIEVAKQVKGVDKVFVSTDDAEIKEIAARFGAEVIDRPAELARDDAPEIEAWRHAISYLSEKGQDFDVFLSLPATSPLRAVSDVDACLNALDQDTDVVITVTPASRSPYFNMVSREHDGNCQTLSPSSGYSRRQDVPEAFDITTVGYAVKKQFILKHNNLFDGKVKSVIVPKERAVDIDDVWDYKFAEVLYGIRQDATEK
jgi:N-acylneuraminate cytidylyltransferase